ncbi:hypothetical protein BN126350103 [Stenotrophomonas thermophila]|nr:hypothetical protein BN126350103 [Stenotrophomonas maltophilia]
MQSDILEIDRVKLRLAGDISIVTAVKPVHSRL